MNNGHVGPNGLYHYHGIAESLIGNSDSSFIGYAGDGFEIHFVGRKVRSGYTLRSGERPVVQEELMTALLMRIISIPTIMKLWTSVMADNLMANMFTL